MLNGIVHAECTWDNYNSLSFRYMLLLTNTPIELLFSVLETHLVEVLFNYLAHLPDGPLSTPKVGPAGS